jgi:hypothetical protein
MTKIRGVTGGGIAGRNVVQTRGGKVEPTSYAVTPGRASNIGMSVHFAKGPLQQGHGYSNPVGPSDGMDCRPGGGRTVMKAGSQSATPNPTSMGRGRDLFK